MKDLKQGARIGSGSFGDVYEGVWRGKERVVLKQYKQVRGRDVQSFYEDELRACRRLSSCSGVASFLGVAGADIFLVWRYEGSITLETLLQRGGGTTGLMEVLGSADEEDAWLEFAAGLLGAIESIHKQGVVHRDVKPGNILLAQSPSDGSVSVKLVDLGGVADLKSQDLRVEEAIFDPVYGAPEQFVIKSGMFGSGIEASGVYPDYQLDAYSAGLVLLQLAVPALHKPQAMKTMRKAVNSLGGVEGWRDSKGAQVSCDFALLENNDNAAWSLVEELTREDPEERLSIKSALKLFASEEKKTKKTKEKRKNPGFWPFN